MGPAGNFRHDSAVQLVQVDLAEHNIAQNPAPVLDDGRSGFVAAGFQGQNAEMLLPPQLLRLPARGLQIGH